MNGSLIPIFDGHNDTLLRLATRGAETAADRFSGRVTQGHIDLPRARSGGFVGGLFAVFPPPLRMPNMTSSMKGASYDMPLPELLAMETAQASTLSMFSVLLRLERDFPEDLAVCRTMPEIRNAIAAGKIAAVLHIEGAEAIDRDFVALDVLHAAGLRSLGLVWSRPNIFAHGVPFRFPSSPDTGEGLSEAGKQLVKACNERHIMIDLSHLNEKGFWDVAALTSAPLVATHSNVHALCPSARNLTGRQLDAIRESRGMVGLNFATCFLRPDGAMRADTDLDLMVRHLDALLEHLGEDGVAFGSDFDGAVVPAELRDVSGLPRLVERLRQSGYSEALLRKLCAENWFSMLDRTWSPSTGN
ncbi:dipeptidase [Lichenifustis flavocetrariae]|uniref:Dipeptidase n=1 Tax=Lichenifustis flavocetrariae TaxID=2949735 RepID=A0AA42CJ56_9HYPH|nr:dipeptidase [Lichenifustis flavocetrariae]MCW6509094.1 dipeptidase [Lichenifustis flavocetrariae]